MIDLYNGKEQLIKKYGLVLKEDSYWYSQKENSHEQIMFKDSFLQKGDIIIILFRIYKLCFAKVNYFRKNIDKYEPYKYHYKKGFIITELWDADFFKHKKTGHILDFRFLQSITKIKDFLQLVVELELTEDKENRDNTVILRLEQSNE